MTEFLGKKISGRFTIPSGIITTNTKIIEKIANEIPQIGVITTKSVGLIPKEGNREPIITQYAPGCFVNAVGLTNPGAEEFVKQLQQIKMPEDKFLLISIFGKDAEEFCAVAKIVEQYCDGIELNLSCPHATGYGMAIGQDKNLVKEITAAVKQAVNKPIIPKLTPNVPNLSEIAKAAMEGGADALCLINTVGPGYYTFDGQPVLTNKKGGMSGKGILPIGLKCVKEASETTQLPIIGCGGISGAEDVKAYNDAGATIYGIGTALAGMTTQELKKYFETIEEDLEKGTDNATKLLKTIDTTFKKCKLVENKKLAEDTSLLIFDKGINIKPGQFIFAWIPGLGEKPFSVLDNNPLTLSIQKRGCFTEKILNLKEGDEVYFRGPYGTPIQPQKNTKIILVSGGCGLAALYQIAKENKNTEIFIGARDKQHLFYIEKAQKIAKVYITTDDGSFGEKGFVTERLKKRLEEIKHEKLAFYNCGPPKMIEIAVEIEKKYTKPENIYTAIDFVTKCGIGICGSCATKIGQRSCIDGPFIGEKQ